MYRQSVKACVYFLLLAAVVHNSSGHGRLWEPPGRSTLWRVGVDAPINYDDHQLWCGGYQNQWERNGGQCGVCGDPFEEPQPRANEEGGKYGLGIIAREYTVGQVIDVHVELTVNHFGWFEFRLCPNNDIHRITTQECLNEHVLELEWGGTRYDIPSDFPSAGSFNLRLRLPPDLTCSQCVLQWHYNTASNWGTCEDGTSGKGCGPQEWFRGCSDVAIHW